MAFIEFGDLMLLIHVNALLIGLCHQITEEGSALSSREHRKRFVV